MNVVFIIEFANNWLAKFDVESRIDQSVFVAHWSYRIGYIN